MFATCALSSTPITAVRACDAVAEKSAVVSFDALNSVQKASFPVNCTAGRKLESEVQPLPADSVGALPPVLLIMQKP